MSSLTSEQSVDQWANVQHDNRLRLAFSQPLDDCEPVKDLFRQNAMQMAFFQVLRELKEKTGRFLSLKTKRFQLNPVRFSFSSKFTFAFGEK